MIIFLFSCGIPDVVYLEPPTIIHNPTNQTDENLKYFEFKTSDAKNTADSGGYFKGFDVFYRIYESESDCKNAVALANKQNENNPSFSAHYLKNNLNFSSLHYKSGGSVKSVAELILATSSDRNIKIVLKAGSGESSEIDIAGTKKKLLRKSGKEFSSISVGDADFKSVSTTLSSSELYIACFAAAYGWDNSFKPIYSGILDLGYIKITTP